MPKRYLFVLWPGAGNQPPAVAIASSLCSQGHTVTFSGIEFQRRLFESNGFSFHTLPSTSPALLAVGAITVNAVNSYIMYNADHAAELLKVIADTQSDHLIIDFLMFGALAAIEAGKVPIPCTLYGHSTISGQSLAFGSPALASAMRAALHLPPITDFVDTLRRTNAPALIVSIPELETVDFQAVTKEPLVRYIGPRVPAPTAPTHVPQSFGTNDWQNGLPWPLAQIDDPQKRPLVLVSFTTHSPVPPIIPDQTGRYQRTLQALSDSSQYRVLCTSSATEVAAAEWARTCT